MSRRVLIPATSFLMGSDDGADNERPVHRVSLDAFQLAVHQVTNAEYDLFLEATGHPLPPHRNPSPEQPVVAVSWFDAVACCEWLGGRLPTEAEWECAARGGAEGMLYPWGNDAGDDDRWPDGPAPVGGGAPNGYGLYDMCQNVHEWCSDWYAADYYALSPEHDPRGPDTGTRRVSRGGSWRHRVKVSRCAAPPEADMR